MTAVYRSNLWGDGEYRHSATRSLRAYRFNPTAGPSAIEVSASGLVSFDDVCMTLDEWDDAIREAREVSAALSGKAGP
jgi:hypothetical protein